MAKRRIAVIGVGKIAQDQHLPVIDASDDFELAATVSTRGLGHNGLPVFKNPGELYAALPDIELVSICTPPGIRHQYVREALDAGIGIETRPDEWDSAEAGKFARIHDPDGNPIELWQPPE